MKQIAAIFLNRIRPSLMAVMGFTIIILVFPVVAALAQSRPEQDKPIQEKPGFEAKQKDPVGEDKSANNNPTALATLDSLFARLAKAQDSVEAKGIGEQIQRLWEKSGSDSADLLMNRVNLAMRMRNLDLALDLLDSIVVLEPQWAEGWNRRATVHFLRDDFDGSMRDIRQTLALEPRHFGAIAGMSLIFQAVGDKKRALKAARAATNIYPFLEGAKDYVDRHSREIEGESL